jgi:hypothetical protein
MWPRGATSCKINTARADLGVGAALAPGARRSAGVSIIDQALQLNRCNVPESPCHWRRFGSDQRLPLLLAKSMLGNWNAACAAAPSTRVGFPA